MITSGAQLIASGVYTTHLLEDLKRPGRRRWRNLVLGYSPWYGWLPCHLPSPKVCFRCGRRAGLRISLAMEK
jgi:hypothetical protein